MEERGPIPYSEKAVATFAVDMVATYALRVRVVLHITRHMHDFQRACLQRLDQQLEPFIRNASARLDTSSKAELEQLTLECQTIISCAEFFTHLLWQESRRLFPLLMPEGEEQAAEVLFDGPRMFPPGFEWAAKIPDPRTP